MSTQYQQPPGNAYLGNQQPTVYPILDVQQQTQSYAVEKPAVIQDNHLIHRDELFDDKSQNLIIEEYMIYKYTGTTEIPPEAGKKNSQKWRQIDKKVYSQEQIRNGLAPEIPISSKLVNGKPVYGDQNETYFTK